MQNPLQAFQEISRCATPNRSKFLLEVPILRKQVENKKVAPPRPLPDLHDEIYMLFGYIIGLTQTSDFYCMMCTNGLPACAHCGNMFSVACAGGIDCWENRDIGRLTACPSANFLLHTKTPGRAALRGHIQAGTCLITILPRSFHERI